MKSRQFFLFSVIFIEGYVVLATELLAMRQLIPFVGSGIEIVSIIISAILLPLAIGYNVGGRKAKMQLSKAHEGGFTTISIRKILLGNLLIALLILVLGLSYASLNLFFDGLNYLGLKHRILQTFVYSLIFLVTPIFLLAQTVPLISNYFSRPNLSEITGKMLFFSTTGSFFGSVISTIVLMAFIGVHNTVIITLALITFLIFFISPRLLMPANVKAIALLALAWLFNNNDAMHQFHIVADTPYSTITMHKMDGTSDVILSINNSMSSKYSANPDRRFAYIHYIETHYINTMNAAAPKNILILGAGGFTVGFEDTRNHYTFVDIDPELKTVAEMHLLPHPLPPNKEFISTSARSFLHRATQKYDLIMIDLYSNRLSIPMEAITKEFLIEARRVLAPEGILIGNIISSPTLQDKFSVRYYRTFASVFPVFDRQIIGNFDGWSQANNPVNTLYIYYNNRFLQDETIYTDDKNTYSFDQ